MGLVTSCVQCGKTYVQGDDTHEWCRKCADHFTEMLTDPDEWVIAKDPIGTPVSDPVRAAVDKAIADGAGGPHPRNHATVEANIACEVIIADDPQGPQPDPAKIDKAVERMNKLEVAPGNDPSKPGVDYSTLAPGKVSLGPITISKSFSDLLSKHVSEVQLQLGLKMLEILRKGLETKDLRYTTPKCDEKI